MHIQTAWPNQSSGMGMMATPISSVLTPRMDLVETVNQVVYILEMPGLTAEQLDVEIEGKNLLVSGTAEQIFSQEEQPIYHLQERVTTAFQRVIPLAEALNPEKIQAQLSNGLLKISFAKEETENVLRQKITVAD